ncbi:MAG: hypothetical protein LiPW16_381 [Microgenomates group bacterium LiPW_16]|nr:MAG: hypothetical protein LiPW16_381 [Microgenomates group bacterium LiPW_16]
MVRSIEVVIDKKRFDPSLRESGITEEDVVGKIRSILEGYTGAGSGPQGRFFAEANLKVTELPEEPLETERDKTKLVIEVDPTKLESLQAIPGVTVESVLQLINDRLRGKEGAVAGPAERFFSRVNLEIKKVPEQPKLVITIDPARFRQFDEGPPSLQRVIDIIGIGVRGDEGERATQEEKILASVNPQISLIRQRK